MSVSKTQRHSRCKSSDLRSQNKAIFGIFPLKNYLNKDLIIQIVSISRLIGYWTNYHSSSPLFGFQNQIHSEKHLSDRESICTLKFPCETSLDKNSLLWSWLSFQLYFVKKILAKWPLTMTILLNNALCVQPAEWWLNLKCFHMFNRGSLLCLSPDLWTFLKIQRNGSCRFVSRSCRGQGWVPTSPAVTPHPLTQCWLLGRRWAVGGKRRKLPAVLAAGPQVWCRCRAFQILCVVM